GGEVVVRGDDPDRPDRQVRTHLALGDALDRDVAVGQSRGDEAPAGEPPARGEPGGDEDRGGDAAASVHGSSLLKVSVPILKRRGRSLRLGAVNRMPCSGSVLCFSERRRKRTEATLDQSSEKLRADP